MAARMTAVRGWRRMLAAALTAGMALALGTAGTGSAAGSARATGAAKGFFPYQIDPAGRTLYLLGTGGCGTDRCPVMYRTADDGARWVEVTHPSSAPDGPAFTAFADPRDGYAMVTTSGSSSWGLDERLERTTDGAVKWTPVALRGQPTVFAMVASRGDFYAAVADCTATACRHGRLLHARRGGPVRATALPSSALPPGLARYGAGSLTMAAWGPKVWLYTTRPAAAHPRPLTLVSTDGGARLRRPGDRLPANLGCDLTASSRSVLWALCSGGMMLTEWRSTDGGHAYAEVHLRALPGTGGAMVAVAGPSVAYVYRGLSAPRLLVTTDGGRTLRAAGRFPLPASTGGDMAFVGPRRGLMIRNDPHTARVSVERTTDGGRRWTRVPPP